MKFRLRCRYARVEGGRVVRYPPGSVVDLNESEVKRLRNSIVVEPATAPAPLAHVFRHVVKPPGRKV